MKNLLLFLFALGLVAPWENIHSQNPQASSVTILGYHRFEDPAKDPLAITPAMFREQLQAIKDAGITVISMEDFLAWRRGEKEIPEKSAVITIDDGYNCTYHKAWPILTEFGYPFTFYVYTNYISAGGRSITWEQLEELKNAGVHIGSHSISHDNMARPRHAKGVPYDTWLWDELKKSKDTIEEKLGIPITTFAYPYGVKSPQVMQKGIEAGYEALFTVAGKKVPRDAPAAEIGRYVIQSDKPETFRAAIRFGAAGTSAPGEAGGPSFQVTPAHRETISEQRPVIQADLSGLGAIDPKSIQMQISGLGQVLPTYDPASGMLRFHPAARLQHKENTVTLKAKAGAQTINTSWIFFYDPEASSPSEAVMEPPMEAAPEQAPPPNP